MKLNLTIVTLLSIGSFIPGINTIAQTAVNEDKQVITEANARDEMAIEEAKNGWWTASMKTHPQRIQWWRDAKFGMFIHWGVYSLPAGEWKGNKVKGNAEHLMRTEKIPRAEYLKVAKQFNPIRFDAEEWVRQAQNAGMKYFIITSKHHDGFALYNSKVSDFDITDQTRFKRDPMAELSAACKKMGMKFGFYYSHAFDWEHPDAPGNDWEYNNPGGDKLLGGSNWYDTHPEWLTKARSYVDQKAIPQIKELLTTYHPDILWFDTPHKLPLSENIRILKAIRETDPNVVINGRLVRSTSVNFGDYKNTADRPAEFLPVDGDWEANPTTNESYGYHQFDSSHKPVGHFVQLLANAVSRGGNLLLNIGPKGDGTFGRKDISILQGIGKWISQNKESIEAGKSPLPFQSWGVSTLKGNKLYLHVFNWPADGKLHVGGLKSNVSKSYFLAERNMQLETKKINGRDLLISVPRGVPDTLNTVIVVELQDKIEIDPVRYVASNIPVTRLLAYDATQHGQGFSFGDGKTGRYYVEGWKNKDQSVSWKFRTGDDSRYRIMIKFLASENSGGDYQLNIDNAYEFGYSVNSRNPSEVITQELAELDIKEGSHVISLLPSKITKGELMKLLEIQLIPIDN